MTGGERARGRWQRPGQRRSPKPPRARSSQWTDCDAVAHRCASPTRAPILLSAVHIKGGRLACHHPPAGPYPTAGDAPDEAYEQPLDVSFTRHRGALNVGFALGQTPPTVGHPHGPVKVEVEGTAQALDETHHSSLGVTPTMTGPVDNSARQRSPDHRQHRLEHLWTVREQ